MARSPHPVILFVGRLSHAKGVDALLHALAAVRTTLPTAELWLVGPSTLDIGNAPLIDRAKQTDGVRLLGSKKQRELPALIQQAWVSVLLSRTTKRWAEQVGMVNLQALACGTPVVSTTSGSIPEYLGGVISSRHLAERNPDVATTSAGSLGSDPRDDQAMRGWADTHHGALLIPENDPRAAAEALLVVLQDPKRRETMGQAGVAWVRDTFDEAVTVPKLEAEIYDRWQAIQSIIDH